MTVNCSNFKNRTAVSIQSNSLKATFLPNDGAKMASLIRIRDGKELLAVKSDKTYRVLEYDGDYVSSECSGFDDMFPTVDPYTPIEGAYRGITYPDHGESSRIPYQLTVEGEEIVLRACSRLFPITYQKRISIVGDAIVISYRIENQGEAPFDFLWAGHMMLQGEDGMELITPFGEDAPIEMMFAPEEVDPTSLSKHRLTGFVPQHGAAYKFYYTDRMRQGRFGVKYPDGSRLLFEVDERKLPYLGIWMNNGSFQDIYTVTPEPCTVPFDAPDRAAKRGITSVIAPQEHFSFEIKITVKEDQNI